MKSHILAAALLLGTSGVAIAADPGMPMEEAPLGFNWTGGYVGAQLGYTWGDGGVTYGSDIYSDISPDGALGGLYAGYNYEFSNQIVLGAEADFAWQGASDEAFRQNRLFPPQSDPEYTDTQDIEWTAAIRGRLGYAMDRWLPYVTAGVAFARVDQIARNNILSVDLGETYTGWTIGAGVEYAATDNVLVRAEYRFSDFGDKNLSHPDVFYPMEWSLKTHDIRLGLAYKF